MALSGILHFWIKDEQVTAERTKHDSLLVQFREADGRLGNLGIFFESDDAFRRFSDAVIDLRTQMDLDAHVDQPTPFLKPEQVAD